MPAHLVYGKSEGKCLGGIHNTYVHNTYVHNTYGLKIPTCVFQNTYRPYHNTYKLFQNTYQHFQALSKYLQAFSKYLPTFSGPIKIPTEISGLIKKNCLIQQEKGCGSTLRPRRP